MAKKIDPRSHVGETHGIYTIVSVLDEKDKYNHWIYKCTCNECGYEAKLTYGDVAAPSSVANECVHLRANGNYITNRHKWINKRLNRIFADMLTRCYNKNDKNYRWYGAKGIKVCQEWLDDPKLFEEWALQNGYKDILTIDRIDDGEDYCPENCRWISLEDNTRRAGKVNWITVNNKTLTGRQWAEKLGLGVNTINTIIRDYGENKATELIVAMMKELPSTKHRKSHQTWFDVYGIQI